MPPATALAFRGLTFWLPMLIGVVLLPRLATERRPDRAEALAAARRRAHCHSSWPVAVAAGLTAVMGLVNVASAVTPSLRARVEALRLYFPVTVRHGSHLTAALAGLALLGLAHGLARRKRAAHTLALLALAVSIVRHLLKGLDWEDATLSASLMLYRVVTRAWFFARSDRPSLWQALRVALAALAFSVLYGARGF